MNQWLKDIARWRVGRVLYLSVPFTWLLGEAERLARLHKGPVVAGGPAVDLCGAGDWAETPGECLYDVLSMHNPLATFTTRGCPNTCEFCAVPQTEGAFRELHRWKRAPLVCDNNILAGRDFHFQKVIGSLLPFPHVDFNQGLDARLFKPWHAGQLTKLKSVKVRFAFDRWSQEARVADALQTARRAGLKDFGVYALIGYDDTPDDAQDRLEMIRSWGVRPNPMRYQPLDAMVKNGYVAEGWTEAELRRMARYYSRLRWLEHIPYADYRPNVHDHPLFAGINLKGASHGSVEREAHLPRAR